MGWVPAIGCKLPGWSTGNRVAICARSADENVVSTGMGSRIVFDRTRPFWELSLGREVSDVDFDKVTPDT